MMAYFTYKRSGKNKYLVIRWKKRINGVPTVVKEISVGTADNLAKILEKDMDDIVVASYTAGSTLSVLRIEEKVGIRSIVNSIVEHGDKGMTPGDYFLLFIMNRLSYPSSKRGIERWMKRDYASLIYSSKGSQDFWNFMDKITDDNMKMIMNSLRVKIIELGYDFSKIFVDASNFYTFMEENDMAKRGHNKKHRYDLNQISYYIASNYDYIPLFFNSYAGNIHESRTFPEIIRQIPENAIVIFDRGYNSLENINMLEGRKYIGSLTLSDHPDLVDLPIKDDSFIEYEKNVYGKNHRIIVYHSSRLQKMREISFMKNFNKVYMKTKKIIESGDYDSIERARIYLESMNMSETIRIPDMSIDENRIRRKIRMLGMNALFTNIKDLSSMDIIDIYRKRNRVEHCFRTINTMDIISPVYHWTPQKIRVHMFMSLIAYLFLSLIYNEIKRYDDSISLSSTREAMNDIILVYLARGNKIKEKFDFKSEIGKRIFEIMKLEDLIRK